MKEGIEISPMTIGNLNEILEKMKSLFRLQ
jgi:hypothetical protein